MNWLVVWWISMQVGTSCPDYKPDPYTGRLPVGHCLVNHFKTVKEVKTQTFEVKADAEKFIQEAPPDIKKRMKLIELQDEPPSPSESAPLPSPSATIPFVGGTQLIHLNANGDPEWRPVELKPEIKK